MRSTNMFRSAYRFEVTGGHDVITPHHHTFRIRIDCEGEVASQGAARGMVVDFAALEQIANDVIRPTFEGLMLDEAEIGYRPTVEHMAKHCFELVVSELDARQRDAIKGVVIWENERCMGAYERTAATIE